MSTFAEQAKETRQNIKESLVRQHGVQPSTDFFASETAQVAIAGFQFSIDIFEDMRNRYDFIYVIYSEGGEMKSQLLLEKNGRCEKGQRMWATGLSEDGKTFTYTDFNGVEYRKQSAPTNR